jgi:Ca-activated chloride channel family protein
MLVLSGLFFLLPVGSAKTLEIDLQAGQDALTYSGNSTTFIKVDLTGIRPENIDRAPLNIAVVIDKSGSMSGQKIEDAKNAAIYLVNQLQAKDIVSIVTYSSGVHVLIPATKVRDKRTLVQRIRNIRTDGNTALFAGVSKGAAEVRKFLNKQRINRIILLSDGLANEGPSSPAELGQLGRSLSREHISVTTLGIGNGYNEDLMTKLAFNSDGNHVFVSQSSELADIFSQELGELFSVTAKEICIKIKVSPELEITRFLGREGIIRGNVAEITLNQVADKQEKYVMLEVTHKPGSSRSEPYVNLDIDYLDPFLSKRQQESRQFNFQLVGDDAEANASTNNQVVENATLQIATINTEKAIELRDAGQLKDAEAVFEDNALLLKNFAQRLDSPSLARAAEANEEDADSVYDEKEWGAKRKQLREEQSTVRQNQAVGSSLNRYINQDPKEQDPSKTEADPEK